MKRSKFNIPAMDCPSEEQMIRMKLEGIAGIRRLEFDLEGRRLDVIHEGDVDPIKKALAGLNLGATLNSSDETADTGTPEDEGLQKRILWWVLAINFGFFMLEMTTGVISRSMGLVADSLDMLADAIVYGLSLYAVGHSIQRKKNVATAAGYFQLALAILGFAEVVRRFIGAGPSPHFQTMIIVSALALAGNAATLWLLQKAKSKEAHMQASMIFTSNDIIINFGVIVAGVLVYVFSSAIPDLVVGAIVFVIVIRGALRILRLGK
jgi:Co/Zn/Cd efflux system component